jgi:hypothetical protein
MGAYMVDQYKQSTRSHHNYMRTAEKAVACVGFTLINAPGKTVRVFYNGEEYVLKPKEKQDA